VHVQSASLYAPQFGTPVHDSHVQAFVVNVSHPGNAAHAVQAAAAPVPVREKPFAQVVHEQSVEDYASQLATGVHVAHVQALAVKVWHAGKAGHAVQVAVVPVPTS